MVNFACACGERNTSAWHRGYGALIVGVAALAPDKRVIVLLARTL